MLLVLIITKSCFACCFQQGIVPLRQNRPGAGKDRPISDPPISDPPAANEAKSREGESMSAPYHYRRRQTMPEMMLKDDIAKFREARKKKGRYLAS